MLNWLGFVVAALAVARLARLVTVDEITAPLRREVAKRGDTLAYFITCPWCVSVWIAPVVGWAVLWHSANRGVWLVLVALAFSWTAGMSQVVEDRIDGSTE